MGNIAQSALIRLALILAASLALTTPGEACHIYSHWAYPWPQKCPPAGGHESKPEKATLPRQQNPLKAAHTAVPTSPSDSPSADDRDRLRAALIHKLEARPTP
jgi:hypothetical protein